MEPAAAGLPAVRWPYTQKGGSTANVKGLNGNYSYRLLCLERILCLITVKLLPPVVTSAALYTGTFITGC